MLLFDLFIGFELVVTMHISHDLCQIMHMFWDNDVVLMPGGEQSFCNDFCVNLCVTGSDDFQCEITNCLNKCNLHFGNSQTVQQPKDYLVYDDELPPPPRRDYNPRGE